VVDVHVSKEDRHPDECARTSSEEVGALKSLGGLSKDIVGVDDALGDLVACHVGLQAGDGLVRSFRGVLGLGGRDGAAG
jgi:hypothetical protein